MLCDVFDVYCRLLVVVCCVLFNDRCLFCVVRCLLFGVGRSLCIDCCLKFVVCCLWFDVGGWLMIV